MHILCVLLIQCAGNNSQMSSGQIAGIVIPILVVLILLAVGGVVIGFVLYRYKPFHSFNKHKGLCTILMFLLLWIEHAIGCYILLFLLTYTEALENPTYDMVTSDSNVVLTRVTPFNGHQTNGRSYNISTQNVDNSNPLYASTDVDGTDGNHYVTRDTFVGRDSEARPAHFHELSTTNTLPVLQQNKDFLTIRDQSYSRSMENLLIPPNSGASAHIGSEHSTPSRVNPYGDYGDKTLQRVASNFSLNQDQVEGERVFDNPDYEDVHLETTAEEANGAAAVGNNDYEDIYNDKDKDYDDIY